MRYIITSLEFGTPNFNYDIRLLLAPWFDWLPNQNCENDNFYKTYSILCLDSESHMNICPSVEFINIQNSLESCFGFLISTFSGFFSISVLSVSPGDSRHSVFFNVCVTCLDLCLELKNHELEYNSRVKYDFSQSPT